MTGGTPARAPRARLDGRDCLVVVDLQTDFLPGGALAVPEGDRIVEPVNGLAARFPSVVATQDWHPADHASFASHHPGAAPFSTVEFAYGAQTLWPDHCVIGSPGADFAPGFAAARAELIVRKGFRREIDSYSAFFENDGKTPTGLAGYLRDRGFQRLFFAGLATDFCVGWSVRDARRLGFEAVLVEDCCRAIDLDGSLAAALADMAQAGATRTRAVEIAA